MFLVLSCNDDEPSFESQFAGDWKLIQMQESFSSEAQTGVDMDWQESYSFKAEGRLSIARIRARGVPIAEGYGEQI